MKKVFLLSMVVFFMWSGCTYAAQHDYNIANAPGAVVRSDINSVLSAIATNNSGATEPSTIFANQWWFDTSTNIAKQRNNANDAWINVALKDGNGWTPYRQGSQIGTGALLTTDTDTAMTADSDSNVPTQKAVKAYADAVQASADTKISKTIAGEINAMDEKDPLHDDDVFVLEDSEDGYSKKKAKRSSITTPADVVLVSTTNWSAATNTGDITIEAEKNYLAIIYGDVGGNTSIANVIFSNQTGATDYGWVYDQLIMNTSPTSTLDADDEDDSLVISGTMSANTLISGKLWIDTHAHTISADKATVHGNIITSQGGNKANVQVAGQYDGSTAVTSFEIAFSTATTGTIKLYRFD